MTSDASCARVAAPPDHLAADLLDHRVRASGAGPDALDRYKSGGLELDSRGER
jgi:hypothetical protein